jgi:hypothetical protein
MNSAPTPAYHDGRTETSALAVQGTLVAFRELLSRNPCAAQFGSETLAELLHAEGYLHRRPLESLVEAALEALLVEGEVLV